MRTRSILPLSLLLISSPALCGPIVIERLEASVNSSLILLSDIQQFRKLLDLRAQLDPLFAGTSLAEKGAKATDEDITGFLVEEKLIQLQFPVTDADAEQEINSIQTNNKIDRAALKQTLKEQGFTYEDYFDLIRIGVAKRNLIDREIRAKVSITDDDLRNFYYNKYAQKSATVKYAYHLKIIRVSPSSFKSAAAATDAANRALKDIKGGEAFEEVAKRMSDDPSASGGGDLGFLSEEQLSPGIRSAASRLQAGQTSELLGNPKEGFFILHLVNKKSGEDDHYEKMKEEIRNQLTTQEFQHQIELWLERQKQNAFIHLAADLKANKK